MAPNVEFITTKQHRRFVEFAEAVRRERYIGLCYGPPGVGKTLSARRYTNWDKVEPYLDSYGLFDGKKCAEVAATRSFLYTPAVHNTPNGLDKRLNALQSRMGWAVQEAIHPDPIPAESSTAFDIRGSGFVELVIVDEADRLKTPSLEQLRDHHDRHGVGLILIGMPGIERRLARYPQLYSRIGFAHEYQPLSADELMFVLTRHWEQLSLTITPDDFTDAEALAAVGRITQGNFRLVQRLLAQVGRILEINQITTITKEVVETARESLIIGYA